MPWVGPVPSSPACSAARPTWNFAGAIVGPVFTAGSVSGQVAQAEAVQKAAIGNYQQVIQAAFGDVSNALIDRQKLAEQIIVQHKLVVALRNYARLANLQYDGGYVPDLTVLQADQQLFPAELNLAATRAASLGPGEYLPGHGRGVGGPAAQAPAPVRGKGPFAPAIPLGPEVPGRAPAAGTEPALQLRPG